MSLPASAAEPAARARDALIAGAGFLRGEAGGAWLDQPWSPWQRHVRARVLGNWLSELDRLLHVLLDDAGPPRGRGRGRVGCGHGRNVAGRLVVLDAAAEAHRPRLHGMARAWAAYRFTGGTAARADVRGGTAMTVGWSAPGGTALRRFGLGEPLVLGGAGLEEVCGFYEGLARRIAPADQDRSADDVASSLRSP